MKKTTDGLRFTRLEVENFKSIDKKIVEIEGKSFLITGRNNIGKSTLIQALLSGIDSKQNPTQAVKTGEQKASTKVTIAGVLNGKKEEYQIDMYYSAKTQKGRLVLLNSLGETVSSPKEVLKSIIGNISFDIFSFLNDTKANKIKILKELSGVRVDIDKLDLDRKGIFDERTFLKRTVEEQEAVMNNHGLTPDDIDKYSEPVEIEPIQEELNSISKKITDWTNVKNKTEGFKTEYKVTIPDKAAEIHDDITDEEMLIKEYQVKIDEAKMKIENFQQYIIELAKEATAAKENEQKGLAWLSKNPEPNAQEISDRLSTAMLHNENCNKVTALAEKQKSLVKQKQSLQKLNDDIDRIDEKKDTLMKNSKLPVKGLRFDNEEIYLNNLPFEEGQINTAQLYEVGFEIQKALNPNLKVLLIHAGSLFDKEALNNVILKAEKDGYQTIAEIVNESNDLEIKFIESEV